MLLREPFQFVEELWNSRWAASREDLALSMEQGSDGLITHHDLLSATDVDGTCSFDHNVDAREADSVCVLDLLVQEQSFDRVFEHGCIAQQMCCVLKSRIKTRVA